MNGYTPKHFTRRPNTATQSKYKVMKQYTQEKPLAEATKWQAHAPVDYSQVAAQVNSEKAIAALQQQNYELQLHN